MPVEGEGVAITGFFVGSGVFAAVGEGCCAGFCAGTEVAAGVSTGEAVASGVWTGGTTFGLPGRAIRFLTVGPAGKTEL